MAERIVSQLLSPFKYGDPRVLVAAFDEPSHAAIEVTADVKPNAVLVFDGLFLHRPDFCLMGDVSVFLEADARCDRDWLDSVLSDLPADPVAGAAELDMRGGPQASAPRHR
ncbi:MAG: hypothetical protein HYX32_03610 [Actinobacteria bacterium]|nr:hypothetical protein [Actinomycetota bacterium]